MKKLIPLFLLLPIISSAQNVGIGALSPTEKLQVDSGNVKIGAAIWSSAANDRLLRFGDGDYVHIGEVGGDDHLEIKGAQHLTLVSNALTISVGTPAAGNVLTSDASGNASWQGLQLPAAAASFKADMTASQSLGSGSTYFISFGSTEYNYGGAYNTGTGGFTAPATGLYHFDIKLLWNLAAGGSSRYSIILALYFAGFIPTEITRTQHFIEAGDSGPTTIELSLDQQMNAGDVVYVGAYQNSGSSQTVFNAFTSFSGHRIF